MRHYSQPGLEGFVRFSERIVLGCGCGERLILLGLKEAWRSEKPFLEWECGARLPLADRIEEEAANIKRLLSGSIRAPAD